MCATPPACNTHLAYVILKYFVLKKLFDALSVLHTETRS